MNVRQNIIIQAQMGSSQVKDEQIDIYMEVHKEFYMAGQQVEGIIFLNAKSSRQYSNLVLRLVGDEHVYWSEGSGKHRRSYSNRYQSYDSVFNVFDFQGQVGQGHYSFPFSFILPSTMSGSFTHSANCYIQYALRAVLNHPSKQDHTQMYQLKLNIMEPMRGQLGGASTTQTTNAQCCGCCKDYGHTTINLNSDKNFVMMGESMNVSGVIDNSQGKAEVQRTIIRFAEKRVVISSGGAVRYRHDRDQVFHAMGKINPGQIENFNLQTIIPQWNSYTAIGRVTARYFLMMVSTELGCCANSPSAALHIVVNTASPTVIKQNKMPPPENWYPHEAPKVINNNMSPFVYQPLPGIPFHNIGQNNVSQNPMGQMGQQPYFQNDGLNGKYQNDAQYQQYENQGNYQAF